jgi:serine protease
MRKLLMSAVGLGLLLSACNSSNTAGNSAVNTPLELKEVSAQPNIVAGDMIVTPLAGASVNIQSLSSNLGGLSVSSIRPMSMGHSVVTLGRGEFSAQGSSTSGVGGKVTAEETLAAIAKLRASGTVESVSPNYIFTADAITPNDTSYASDQWDLPQIKMPDAWEITKGSSNIVVAVLDTGMVYGHPDLAGRTLPGYDMISNPASSSDGDGRDANAEDSGDGADCGRGYSSSSFHGTHVAGTIGAASNNATGITGINWVSKIQPVRVLGKCGGTFVDILDGIAWAAGLPVPGVPMNPTPAKVLNMSLGAFIPTFTCALDFREMEDLFTVLAGMGVTTVVSAGNNNANTQYAFPASCTNVINVAATGKLNDRKAYYSNFGPRVDLSAPGGELFRRPDRSIDTSAGILSTLSAFSNDPARTGQTYTYAYYQGTSMAAPHVTGVVSLMYSLKPNLTFAQVKSVLRSTAAPFNPSSNCFAPTPCGYGMLDAKKALEWTKFFR